MSIITTTERNVGTPGHDAQPRRSGYEILQSCKREGWKHALAEVLELNGQVKVIFPDGRTAYARIES